MANVILKTVIVEDSATQRESLCKLVEKHPDLALIGAYEDGLKAKKALSKNKVDLILLDIEIPILNGFDLVESLKEPPQTIIISSKAEYALRAFDYDSTDYLVKPIDKARFKLAIKKSIHKNKRQIYLKKSPKSIFINTNFQKKKIYLDHIKWIEALGDYIKVVTTDDSFLIHSSLKAMKDKIQDEQFVRIHKSFIVNANKIEKWGSKNVVIGGIDLPMSRYRKEELNKIMVGT